MNPAPLLSNTIPSGEPVTGWAMRLGLEDRYGSWLELLLEVAVIAAVMWGLAKVLDWMLSRGFKRLSIRTTTNLDDHLVDQHVPRYVARLVPLIMSYHLIPEVLEGHERLIVWAERAFVIFFVVLFIRIVRALMRAMRDTLQEDATYRDKPLDSYLQVGSLVLYLIGAILIFSQLTGKSAFAFLTAMGAASAVLLLIFKDAILGFVASIQISANDMVRIGDWITMAKYGADGDVEEINLTTVKVVNFDKTITTIPTYALISDSFQNWRGMQESGGRRIKRSVRLKLRSIRFLEEDEVEALRGIELLRPYIDERRAEIRRFNTEHAVDKRILVNGRNLTNAGLYRTYINTYLGKHPKVHQDMARMVRQLPPDEYGLPLEIYCFTREIDWPVYEGIMADIFDHVISAHPYFHLELHELPAADDVRSIGERIAGSGSMRTGA